MQAEFVAEPSPCPVCDATPDSHTFLFTKQQATFVRCRNCAFVFINPRPSSKWLASRYEYYGVAYFTNRAKIASDFNVARHHFEIALLGETRGRLLDVGCATGSFVAAAKAAGFDARGIDISAESTRYGREVLGLALDVGDLYEQHYRAESFDVVTLWATLEHLPDPNRFLAEAHRLLAPGGRIAVSVPNYASLAQRVLGRQDRYVGIDHVNYFTRRTAGQILGRHGFSVETVRTARFSPVVFWQDLRGNGSDGASVERQLADQRVTDRFKYANGLAAAARNVHGAVAAILGAAGLGDILYLLARKSATS
ncbi:MAG TPA: class I SAM-dependent methyltransferase [Gemmatimonadales bacterium]|nr:class I SAM-dependent methyltransferase [Gemmatimonadales bacterium]